MRKITIPGIRGVIHLWEHIFQLFYCTTKEVLQKKLNDDMLRSGFRWYQLYLKVTCNTWVSGCGSQWLDIIRWLFCGLLKSVFFYWKIKQIWNHKTMHLNFTNNFGYLALEQCSNSPLLIFYSKFIRWGQRILVKLIVTW